ncbi:MBL fold metallo-hydrolase [Halococcoides cellulosivorans]|uniref:MBL fold metallo-hydrolase n=1 Tax=Halococcoides cellulosivorans TaxID=1679096 RepID=A0A2R4WZE9_9EURY|nr:MBL fold metallo-hydrolase [Halococcoides cellulosivorans]AWB26910.1 MBL fold metallo-hydrolase [Halococcoides cellulosivorans]
MAHELGTSDWGDWLLDRIRSADPVGVAVWYLGCNGLVLKASDGTTVFVDPYCGLGDPPRTVRMLPVPFDPDAVRSADAVLSTHEHSDHVHGPTVGPILANTAAHLYGPPAATARTREESWGETYGLANARSTVEAGDTISVGSLTINVEESHDPDAETPVAYVIEHDAGTIVHPGDGRPSEAFDAIGDQYDPDLGVVAVGSSGMLDKPDGPEYTRWYNDPNECAEAANRLGLDCLVPTHFDVWRGLTTDPTVLHDHVRSFDAPERVSILEIGDRIDLPNS